MKRVLILGGGFGGLSAAHTLRQKLASDDEITLIDRRAHFSVGFRKSWVLTGESTFEAGQGRLAHLGTQGIRVLQGTITALDPKALTVEVDGQSLEADAIVVALGAKLSPDNIPGFAAYGYNVYDALDIPPAAKAIREFTGGKVVVGIFGVPIACPPAPYEIAIKVNELLRERGVNASVGVFSPQAMSIPVLGENSCNDFESELAARGVEFLPNHKATAVEPGKVIFASGESRPFDLLLGIPPHQCPPVVVESGLTSPGGWVKVNPRTMETSFPGVYAVGDTVEISMANGKPLPKAGVFAEAMGRVAAERIAATFAGKTPEAQFEGEGGCYLEVSNGEAMMVRGHFLAEPAPEVMLTEASSDYLDQKRAYETQLLETWFK